MHYHSCESIFVNSSKQISIAHRKRECLCMEHIEQNCLIQLRYLHAHDKSTLCRDRSTVELATKMYYFYCISFPRVLMCHVNLECISPHAQVCARKPTKIKWCQRVPLKGWPPGRRFPPGIERKQS